MKMPLTFKKVDEVENLDAEVLLAERLNALRKKPVSINAMQVKQGSVTFGNFRGTAGGGIVTKYLTEWIDRVLAAGGDVVAPNCMKRALYELKNIG